MATKSKKTEKVKPESRRAMLKTAKEKADKSREFYENIGKEKPQTSSEAANASMALVGATASVELDHTAPKETAGSGSAVEKVENQPQALTLPLITDSATLFIQGAQQLTAQLLGTPECAPMLVRVNEWIAKLGEIKKLITGDEDKIEGLKAKVISDGQPWGEKGSKQMVLAGAIVKVKAVNHREAGAPLTISDLDAGKVEAYLRANAVPSETEKVLSSHMKATIKWSLADLSPQQQTNLAKMLVDPGEWGQGLRECLKETKYQMMAPEMINE